MRLLPFGEKAMARHGCGGYAALRSCHRMRGKIAFREVLSARTDEVISVFDGNCFATFFDSTSFRSERLRSGCAALAMTLALDFALALATF